MTLHVEGRSVQSFRTVEIGSTTMPSELASFGPYLFIASIQGDAALLAISQDKALSMPGMTKPTLLTLTYKEELLPTPLKIKLCDTLPQLASMIDFAIGGDVNETSTAQDRQVAQIVACHSQDQHGTISVMTKSLPPKVQDVLTLNEMRRQAISVSLAKDKTCLLLSDTSADRPVLTRCFFIAGEKFEEITRSGIVRDELTIAAGALHDGQRFVQVTEKRVRVLYNGIDTPCFLFGIWA